MSTIFHALEDGFKSEQLQRYAQLASIMHLVQQATYIIANVHIGACFQQLNDGIHVATLAGSVEGGRAILKQQPKG